MFRQVGPFFPMRTPSLLPSGARVCVAIFLFGILSAGAEVRLPAIFSDRMILQRSPQTPVWGWANPGEQVKVTMGDRTAGAIADSGGQWKVALDLTKQGIQPSEMEISGQNRIVLRDVLVGQVWLASGQSNMGFRLSRSIGAKEAIAQSANPLIREFAVAAKATPEPQDDCGGRWLAANPETAPLFSAVAYYFAEKLHEETGEPVGMINASWGGTKAESWTSDEALSKDPDLASGRNANRQEITRLEEDQKKFAGEFQAFLHELKREDHPALKAEEVAAEKASSEGWRTVKVPGEVTPSPGAVWLRKEVDLTDMPPNYPLRLIFPDVAGFDTVYWNGQKIAETPIAKSTADSSRLYSIPPELVREGKNTIVLRIFSPLRPPALRMGGKGGKETPSAVSASLAGDWLAKTEFELPPIEAAQLQMAPSAAKIPFPPKSFEPQSRASHLFNGMIHPVIPYGIAGFLWYQGESNTSRARQYRVLLPLMIADWRERWGNEQLPFYLCQLANYQPKLSQPSESVWAELRESQMIVANQPGNDGAILIDIGEEADIHPRDKRTAAERLAAVALAKTYKKNVLFSGPKLRASKVEEGKIRLAFDHAEGGLKAAPPPATYQPSSLAAKTKPLPRNSPDGDLEGFAICGKDKKWTWAEAKIQDGDVLVWSPQVLEPVAVRYAWADNPTCNLVNGAGFPASPFRTDDFPLVTTNKKYWINDR